MRQGIAFAVEATDRARLETIVGDRNRPQKHVWRARIILLTADGVGTTGIERQTGKDKTCVWRWQERFMREGVDGLLRDKTRPSGKPPLATTVIERVVALTGRDPPGEATHWTAAAMAKSVGISIGIWRVHACTPITCTCSSSRTIPPLPPSCATSWPLCRPAGLTPLCRCSTRSRNPSPPHTAGSADREGPLPDHDP